MRTILHYHETRTSSDHHLGRLFAAFLASTYVDQAPFFVHFLLQNSSSVSRPLMKLLLALVDDLKVILHALVLFYNPPLLAVNLCLELGPALVQLLFSSIILTVVSANCAATFLATRAQMKALVVPLFYCAVLVYHRIFPSAFDSVSNRRTLSHQNVDLRIAGCFGCAFQAFYAYSQSKALFSSDAGRIPPPACILRCSNKSRITMKDTHFRNKSLGKEKEHLQILVGLKTF